MDLNELAVFVKVAETRSVSAAARALSLPKSTVSRRLASLEAALGVSLAQRGPREVHLTDAGRLLHERCARLVADADAAGRAVQLMQVSSRGMVRMSAGFDFGTQVVAPLAVEFMKLHPYVSLDLMLTDRAVDLVKEDVDLALRIGPVKDPSLVVKRLGTTSGVFCAAPSYLARQGEPRDPHDLATHDCIAFASPVHSDRWAFVGPTGETQVDVRVRLRTNSLSLVRDAAVAGLGVARLPLFMCQGDLREGQLRRVLPGHAPPPRPVHVVHTGVRHMPPRVRAWVDFLVTHCALG